MKKLLLIIVLSIPNMAFSEHGNTINVDVNGMVCDFCARGIEKSFGKRDEVTDIDVSLEDGTVKIHLKDNTTISDEDIKKMIADNGLNVTKIHR